jgi:YfiH family protein
MITQEKGVFLAAMGADCALVLLYDPAAGAVGIVHAGWRGTVLGIVEQGVRKMRREFGCDPAKIIAGIGPSIGPCCYEVGNDVKEAALAGRGIEEVSPRAGKLFFDLRKANVDQLLAQGVPRGNIEVADICTSCAHDRFFSYRRDGPTGGRACGIVGWMK